MAQLRFVGFVDKTLIDVASLTNNTIITVYDAFAQRLLDSFPNDYEVVAEVSDVTPAPVTDAETTTQDTASTPITSSTKSSRAAATDTTTTN